MGGAPLDGRGVGSNQQATVVANVNDYLTHTCIKRAAYGNRGLLHCMGLGRARVALMSALICSNNEI